MKSINKKGQVFEQMGALAVGIAGLAITLVIVFLVLSKGRESMSDTEKCVSGSTWNGTACCVTGADTCTGANLTTTSTAYDSTVTLGNAAGEIPAWISLIVIAVIGGLILGLVAMFRNK